MTKMHKIVFVALIGIALYLYAQPKPGEMPPGAPPSQVQPASPPQQQRVIPAQSNPTDAEKRRLNQRDDSRPANPPQGKKPESQAQPPQGGKPAPQGPQTHPQGPQGGKPAPQGPQTHPQPPQGGKPVPQGAQTHPQGPQTHPQPPQGGKPDHHGPQPPPPIPPHEHHPHTLPKPPKPLVRSTPEGWYDDYNAALTVAKQSHRPMLVLFTGSDWCSYCKKLRKDVLNRSKFKDYAEEELILVYVDSPSGFRLPHNVERMHKMLERTLGAGGGVPHTVLVSPDGRKLGEISGYRKESEYLKEIRRILRDAGYPRRDRW